MNTSDQEKFQKNYIWFNQFFGDLKQLMDKISSNLISNFKLGKKNVSFYYPKLNAQPTIPPYIVTALGNKAFVVQVFAVMEITLFPEQNFFKRELSLIIVKHSRIDKVLWPEDYGIRIIKNKQVSLNQLTERVISGEILTGDSRDTKYFAFQVSLDHFGMGKDINAAIQSEIIDVMRELPDWTPG